MSAKEMSLQEIDTMLDKELEKEQPSRFPDTFKFKDEGDELRGILKRIRHAETELGTSPVGEVMDRHEKLWSVWLSPMDLQRKWGEANVEEGDNIAIRFVEMVGRMKLFKLAVVHKNGAKVSADFIVEKAPEFSF